MNIKELEITKGMYNEAKKIENLYNTVHFLDCETEEWRKADDKFQKDVCNEFNTLEIINEYERREANTDNLLSKNQNVYEFTYIGDVTKEFKFFACRLDKKNEKLYIFKNNIYGNPFPAVIDARNIKNVKCIERNNNFDFQ